MLLLRVILSHEHGGHCRGEPLRLQVERLQAGEEHAHRRVKGHRQDMEKLRLSYLKNAAKQLDPAKWSDIDRAFVAADVKKDLKWLDQALKQI